MTRTSPMMPWLIALRPKTLPAALAPVMIGTAQAAAAGSFAPLPATAALLVALLLQIGVNLANDYFDFVKGIDTDDRLGPVRVTQSGLISPAHVRTAMIITLVAAGLAGASLVFRAGWPVGVVGVAAVASALAYSGGPYPLASNGLGDLFVFIFFGPVAVCGTFYVQALSISWTVLVLSIPPGLLVTAILVVNNLRDIDTDANVGKRTLAVVLGRRNTRVEYAALIAGAYVLPVILWFSDAFSAWIFLPLLSLPAFAVPMRTILTETGRVLNRVLAATALLTLLYCLLLSAGILL